MSRTIVGAVVLTLAAWSISTVAGSTPGTGSPLERVCTEVVDQPRQQMPPRNEFQATACLVDAASPLPSLARIIDVRSRVEYSQFHISNALNQPPHSLVNTRAGPLVVYDSGHFRSDALQLCERLERYGLQDFKVIDGGIAAWVQSRGEQGALAVSRLSDAEASAALAAGTSAVLTLSESFLPVLRSNGITVSAANPSPSGRTIILAVPGSHDRIAGRLRRRAGQNTVFYWMGNADQLAGIIGAHLAQDRRRRQGPMVSPNCPGT